MKQKLCLGLCLLSLLGVAGRLWAQVASVQFNQALATYNLQSVQGVPISTTVNTNIGSNGKQPTTNASGSGHLATTNQFSQMLSFGAVTATTNNSRLLLNNPYLQGSSNFNGTVAQQMQLPVGLNQDGTVAIVLQRARVGAPYLSQAVSFDFGAVIPPPVSDYTGTNLTVGFTYWRAIPLLSTNPANNLFYYSTNAGVVFATQPGQITITWITSAEYTTNNLPPYTNQIGRATGTPSYFTNSDGTFSLLFTANYLVSPNPVKTPQKMYWTEGSFQSLSHPVVVPVGQITAINVVFNSAFPQFLTNSFSVIDGITNGQTLWFDSSLHLIRANSAVGRVFVELLGQPNGNNSSEFLGFEIVDVAQVPTPSYVTNYLGTELTAYQDPTLGAGLTIAPIPSVGTQFYYDFEGTIYYADQATTNLTDLQMYWTDTGVAGLQWPYLFNRYSLVWPSDPALYSHYLRPPAATQAQAAQTAVQLDPLETPSLDYFDPLDKPRAFLTPNSFYTWLTNGYPALRALLRFNAGGNVRFERVFSYLSEGLQNNQVLAGSVATNLSAWNPTNNTLTNFASSFDPPYVTNVTVNVGDRIPDPAGELGSTNGTYGDYWAGYINTNLSASFLNTTIGSSYDPDAYVDPFLFGFELANEGAIIPVNAIPGQNHLEVWWFRPDNANNAAGFETVYWPSVIGDYTIQWPANAPAIVLAGNAGSGPLGSLRASGSIYYQNDPTQPGYNPNEEHALMLGGQAYALRDDLNITNGPNYSSAPYVLIAYNGTNGRPAMSVYQVMRENPAAGIYFDYIVTAGTQLQAPMPLPLMALPIAPDTNYPTLVTNYDTEPVGASGDLPTGWTSTSANGPFSLYQRFTYQDRKNNFWVYRGLNAGLPPLEAGAYDAISNAFDALPAAMAVVSSNFQYFIPVSRQLASLTVGMNDLPPGLTWVVDPTNGLSILGQPATTGAYPVTINLRDTADGSSVTLPLTITVNNPTYTVTNVVTTATNTVSTITTNPSPMVALGPLVITSTNIYSGQLDTYSNRPPSLAQAPTSTNSFTMRFYYKTLPGFAWPSLGNASNWPAVGSIVPYLRPLTNGVFAGDQASSNTPSLDIVYRPVWPELGLDGLPLPTLAQGQTLTTAVNGIAAVRGQDSVQVIYQQSIATNAILTNTAGSVVLFDPTVQKKSSLGANGLPASVLTDVYNGLDYFPNLPPNLISRLWYDPNQNALIFEGQYVADPVNGNYVMLNVLRGNDLAAVDGLCPTSDAANYSNWTNAVANLATPEYTFYENPLQPGSYVIDPADTVTRYAGDLVEVTNSDTAVDSYAMSAAGPGQGYVSYVVADGHNPQYAGDPVSVYIVHTAPPLFPGSLVVVNSANASPFSQLITFQHTADLAGRTSEYLYDWRIEPPVNGQPPALGTENSWTVLSSPNPAIPLGPVYTLGASGVQGISDNYVSMRYGYRSTNEISGMTVVSTNWSQWANPILAEGWITRVTQALDPIAGQTRNLYENPANTTASIIELAGGRWDGDVPLNEASLTNNGLIQLYETVLDVGESLSIDAGINYGPANQALLTAAGYLNDLYMTLGNAAWANSLNPTISFGTDNLTYGSVATASFCFEGEVPTLLAQNEALLRGRDDSLAPGVDLPPVYNRLYWNYTYGISAGETIYALNYNITDQNGDGVVNAADAEIMFPQGHGDAYGHYLTAMMEYYKLLMNPNFDWVPQAQAVLILGATVTVNYENETKFAEAAAAVARTGRQIFDLEWRQDYMPGTAEGWDYFATNYVGQYTYIDNNGDTQHITRYWGMDHWASRVGQGTYLNWVVGNSILPYQDPNPNDQGVQIVDRQTVQDLQELPATAAALEADLDNANAGFTPLGLAQNAIPFDINPQDVTGSNPQTHFEQIYARAVQALNNAVVAFNAAQNVTQDLREEQNSLSDLQAAVTAQELAYNDQLIELYGTPYPEDIGPGGAYPQGYTGPDLIHYMYVDDAETNTYGGILPDPTTNNIFTVDIQQFPTNWYSSVFNNFNFITLASDPNYTNPVYADEITFNIGPDGFSKPASWTEERGSIGSLQTALAAENSARDQFRMSCYNAYYDKLSLDQAILLFNAQSATNQADLGDQQTITSDSQQINNTQTATSIVDKSVNDLVNDFNAIIGASYNDTPDEVIAGLADGGDFLAPLKAVITAPIFIAESIAVGADDIQYAASETAVTAYQNDILNLQQQLATDQNTLSLQNAVQSLGNLEGKVQGDLATINQAAVALNGAQANYQALVAQGNRIQQERLTFRQHTAAQVQGYTVADAAFLVFQNEDLERYTTLFNLAAEYAYMAANAYDYETGLLGTPAGQSLLNQIISSSALGVIQNGEPQISGTDTGDPGLANALAEMDADWEVLKGRLGFNNPDGYGTTVSLRSENYRILPGPAGDTQWQQLLEQNQVPDLLADTDVKNNCLQIDDGSGSAVPGIELTFSTTITDGVNLFGQPLGPGDHSYSSTSFATKIFAVGVCFDGYQGMDNPVGTGGTSPGDPTLDANGLAATPYIYLIPCGADSMRSPPLGDTSTVRTWNVDDVAIPLPFNVGASDFSSTPFYTSSDSLSEPLFAVRKQQAFRPVSTTEAFNTSIYGAAGALEPSQYTNQRLIGRSIWNSKWKLIIPGKTLLSDPNEGLTRFINSVTDVHLYFITYSYAGN
ncbi:MAG: hypothetical protein ABSH48_11930 [Verrucomicrobiota bacterium]